jgi:carboxylesterase
MLLAWLIPVLALAAAVLWLRADASRLMREADTRLRRGAGGIIVGAEAIELTAPPSARAVLLIHGFGDTPQTLTYLASALQERGYAVSCPLLPGHGRTVAEFAASVGDEWLHAASDALHSLRRQHGRVGIVGLSMGGAVASLLASGDERLPALVLMAPYLEAPPIVRAVGACHRVVALWRPYLGNAGAHSIEDPIERERSLAYRVSTPGLVRELVALSDRARAALPAFSAPTLIVQSRHDNRLSLAVAERALARLGSREKRLELVEGRHVITVDLDRRRVIVAATAWLDAHLG